MTLQGLATIVSSLPLSDIEAAIQDPSSLGNEAKVAEDIIVAAMPGLTGAVIAALVQLFVAWVYASGGGTITPDPNPITDGQTTPTPHTGRNG